MVLEVAILNVTSGREEEFEAAFDQAQSIIAAQAGYLSHQLQRCRETEGRYLLLVRWQTIEHHTEGFRNSADFQEWKKQLHQFYGSVLVEHYTLLYSGKA